MRRLRQCQRLRRIRRRPEYRRASMVIAGVASARRQPHPTVIPRSCPRDRLRAHTCSMRVKRAIRPAAGDRWRHRDNRTDTRTHLSQGCGRAHAVVRRRGDKRSGRRRSLTGRVLDAIRTHGARSQFHEHFQGDLPRALHAKIDRTIQGHEMHRRFRGDTHAFNVLSLGISLSATALRRRTFAGESVAVADALKTLDTTDEFS